MVGQSVGQRCQRSSKADQFNFRGLFTWNTLLTIYEYQARDRIIRGNPCVSSTFHSQHNPQRTVARTARISEPENLLYLRRASEDHGVVRVISTFAVDS